MSTKKKKFYNDEQSTEEKTPEFIIEKGVSLPNRISLKYPIEQMEVGDSFKFPIKKKASVAQRARKLKEETGATFAVRKVDNEFGRIWRVQ